MLTCHEILGFMPQGVAQEILDHAFTSDKEVYRLTLKAVAEARKLRPVFFQRKPRAEQHREILATLCRPRLEAVASQLLCAWLLKAHPAMLADFLDSLGIPHERGVISQCPAAVEDARLNAAVDALLAKYPQEKVAVYLHVFDATSDAHWPNLAALLQTDARLQLS
jgi:hypothetical protein